MKRLTVVIPSRKQPQQGAYLERAINSVQSQSVASRLSLNVVVAIDQWEEPPPSVASKPGVRFVESNGRSQVAALNAGMEMASGDYISFLEDDDQWQPQFVELALTALSQGDFVSSTQLEIDEQGSVVRINDFATPSGWLMPVSTWERVGAFDASYRYHLDNEWLGRLANSGARRIHMIEATAPVHLDMMRAIRPWLYMVTQFGGPQVRYMRHQFLAPQVLRMVHPGSGMAQIATNPESSQVSQREFARLTERFGHVPW